MKKMRLVFLTVLAVAMSFVAIAQVENHTTKDGASVIVERAAQKHNSVHVIARHPDGRIFYDYTNHNLRTNAGGTAQGSQMGNTSTQAASCNYIALTSTAITPAAGDTTLSGEIASSGLTRAQGSFAQPSTTQFTITKTFTASGSVSNVQGAGLFNASSTGTLCFENTFTAVSLSTSDTLQVTWTINY